MKMTCQNLYYLSEYSTVIVKDKYDTLLDTTEFFEMYDSVFEIVAKTVAALKEIDEFYFPETFRVKGRTLIIKVETR